jgi:tetratricopeptide (TPR) repeat protein
MLPAISDIPSTRIKAFLCHSSVDKPYVDTVARRLGRARVTYDAYTFENGVKFLESIRSTLSQSQLFVLFASRQSLESLWVKFETSEAEELLRLEILRSALVIVIDPTIKASDTPSWMRRALIETIVQPSRAARTIEYHLNRFRGLGGSPLFLGREALQTEFAQKLIPQPEARPPRLLIVGGLNGIGRRSFLRRASRDLLSLQLGPVFVLQPTDGIDALHLLLYGELGALDTQRQTAAAIESFQRSDIAQKGKAIAQMLASTATGNWMPTILDEGALLDADTTYIPEALAIFRALEEDYPDVVVAVCQTRRPNVEDIDLKSINAIYQRVPPLDLPSTTLLLTQSLRRAEQTATAEQVSELSPYLDGYPPAVNVAVSLSREYGLGNVIADKSSLVNFKMRTFTQILARLPLDEEDWEILRVLGGQPLLPLEALAAVRKLEEEEIAPRLRRLIDLNLVLPLGAGFQISAPIRTAVFSAKGTITDAEFQNIADRLRSAFWSDSDELPPIEIVNATVHAVARSNSASLVDFKGIVLPSVLFKAAKENYDRFRPESWGTARTLSERVLDLVPNHRKALVLLCKILVRLTEWKEAERVLEKIKANGFVELPYLTGFLQWKHGNLKEAVVSFRAAIASGHLAPEAYHGLTSCLIELDNLPDAEDTVRRGLRGRRPNPLLLDLGARVAILQGKLDEASGYIDQMKRLGEDADYHHRLSTLLNARKKFQEALEHAQIAANTHQNRFEVLANLVDLEIEMSDFNSAAEELSELEKGHKTAGNRRDVLLGLRCKLSLKQNRWREAEDLWKKIDGRTKPVHLALRVEILKQRIKDSATSPGQRAEAETELNGIRTTASSRASTLAAQVLDDLEE